MKRNIMLSSLLISCLLLVYACKKDATAETYTGTLVPSQCGTLLIALADTTGTVHGYTWGNYKNVLGVRNTCLLSDMNLKAGEMFSFKISDTNVQPGSNCAVPACVTVWILPPATTYVYDIKKLN